jgi:ABC-2 type transport system permease protein
MVAVLNKYRSVFLMGIQSNVVYRWNFAIRSVFGFFQLVVVFVLWRAAYASAPRIGGFGFGQTLTYFVTLMVIQFFIGAFNEDYQINEEIRNGLINQFLLKPVNYFAYRFSIFSAARVVSGALVLIPFAISLPLIAQYLVFPHGVWRIVLGLPALALGGLIQFTIAYCFGMLTFWFLEIQGFVILSMALESILGGQMFPLDLLPPALYRVTQFLPFYYQMYFPAAILTGRLGGSEALRQLPLQVAWVLALAGLATLLWRRGLRRHTAVGG